MTASRGVLIVGTGLLGTSLGLALRRPGVAQEVWLDDVDRRRLRLAVDLGAGQEGPPSTDPAVIIVAVPPRSVVSVVRTLGRLYPNSTISDMASVKSRLIVEIDETLNVSRRFVGGHPMSGRERSGPEAARGDLFEGRPWVVTPGPSAGVEHVTRLVDLVRLTGAEPVVMSAADHDVAVATVSHAPQVLASALAAQLSDAPDAALDVAGPGIRDVTRIAASDPDLWVDILAANAGPVAKVLTEVVSRLVTVRDALASTQSHDVEEQVSRSLDSSTNRDVPEPTASVLRELLVAGRVGHARLPGKHGAPAVSYAVVPVVIPDEPGALARLFLAAGAAGVNIEDVAIEHAAGQPVGLVELSVRLDRAAPLTQALHDDGWRVH